MHIDELPGVQFVHGSALDEDEYLVSVRDAIEPLMTDTMPLTFFGHTHLQGGFVAQGEISEAYRPGYRTVGQPESSDWPLRRELRFLINPGSVGQPRDGDWRACYILLDDETIQYRRVEYDIETTIKKIYAIPDLENFLGDRLRDGR